MYVLMLVVIFLILFCMAVLISSSSVQIPVINVRSTINIDQNKLLDMYNKISPNPITIGSYPDVVSRGKQITSISSDKSCSIIDGNFIGLYNMSVKKLENGYAGVIRGSTWNGCCSTNKVIPPMSYVYYITLNEDGSANNLTQIDLNYTKLDRCSIGASDVYANGIEDPRYFIFNNEEWVIANVLGSEFQEYPCTNSMCIFKISDSINTFRILNPPSYVPKDQRQKNWSPFEYKGRLYCEYSINPHVILEINIDTGIAIESFRTETVTTTISDITSETSLRGGTPPIIIKMNDKNVYLGIGHDRTRNTSDYRHFFYTFEVVPPFRIINVTKPFKLDGSERIQFAAGLSEYNDIIYISYGINDCFNRISYLYVSDVIDILNDV